MMTGMPHPLRVVMAAVVLSILAALLGRRTIRQRLAYSTYLLVTSIGVVIAGSWVMHFMHG